VIFLLAITDWDALLEVVWVSIVAGLGTTTAFAAGLLGMTRWIDLSRSGRTPEGAVFGVLGIAGMAAFLGAVVFSIIAMADK